MPTIISIICALSENRTIGKDNKLLWYIPEDLKRFKVLTMGKPLIMGRKTYESIGKPLPGRTNIIITRDPEYKAEGCLVYNSLEKAMDEAKKVNNEEIFIIGGGQIYNQAIDLTDKLYLTLVAGEYEADTFFPDYSDFKKIISSKDETSNGFKYKYLILERNKDWIKSKIKDKIYL